jgi:glutamate dehydrogenase (NAD(P)+)
MLDEHATVVRYVDPLEEFVGYVAFAGTKHRLAAGGFRVQQGLDEETTVQLAEAMARKERLLGLGVDGAKAGIDYDPASPGKHHAMLRFLGFLRPYLDKRLSLGPDMGTSWNELETVARRLNLSSVKAAVRTAQGLDEEDFLARLRLLDVDVLGATLGERRAGHALAHATLAAIEVAGLSGRWPRVGVHGFGTLGRGAAIALTEAGVTPTVVTDEHTCLHCREEPADATAPGPAPSSPARAAVADVEPPTRFFDLPLDVLVLASCTDALSAEQAARVDASVVVVGSNLGITPAVETILHERGIFVVPDFVGGCGGSASMDALFGPPACPGPRDVLGQVGATVRSLVAQMSELSKSGGISTREAALRLARDDVPPGRPYGRGQAHRDTHAMAGRRTS